MPWRLGLLLLAAVAVTGCAAGASACKSPVNAEGRPSVAPFSTEDCRFHNLPNPDARASRSGWKIWTRFLTAKKEHTRPAEPLPMRPVTRAQLDALDPGANHLIRLGHSSVLLKLRGAWWLIDPMFGERASPVSFAGPKRFQPTPLALAELPPIEGVILSHDHYDHLDVGSIEGLRDRVRRWFVPLGVGARLREMGVAADRIEEFDWWQAGRLGEVRLTATPAQHFSGRGLFDRDRTLWASWVLESGDQRIFYSGDSGYSPGFAQIGERFGGFDIALMENGAYDAYWPSVHMQPEESVRAFRDVRARVLLPLHNSAFDLALHTWHDPLDRVADIAARERIELATPRLGEVLTVGVPRENVRWWQNLE
ncbi:MAG TPA: MBL fold metallo-hydrolase [Variovorax sp.]|nr:MBL fold metallo-hydrolase [Variovorax sp.]